MQFLRNKNGMNFQKCRCSVSGFLLVSNPQDMVKLALHVIERGFPALKVRCGRPSLDEDLAVLAAVRDAVGDCLERMVDCNQGWRMSWDITTPWNVDKAVGIAREREKLKVNWMKEPLHRGHYDGYKALCKQVNIRISGGELTREDYEFHALLRNDCLDVYHPDVACTLGMEDMRRLAFRVEEHGHILTPHTWGNGIGLAASIHIKGGPPVARATLNSPTIRQSGRRPAVIFCSARPSSRIRMAGWC